MAKKLVKYDTATGKHFIGDLSPDEMSAVAKSQVIEDITLDSASWSLVSGLYEYDYSNALILTTSIISVVPQNSTIDIVIDAEILPYVLVSDGAITIYSKNEPTDDILINLIIQI